MGTRLIIYRALNGHAYFKEWIAGLDKQTSARVQQHVDRLSLGNFGDSKPVGEGVQELRMHFGPGWRVYYGIDGPDAVVLLAGSDKSDQDKAIMLAKTLWKEYKLNKHAS